MEIIIYTKADNHQNQILQGEIIKNSNISPFMVFDFQSLFESLRHKLYGKVIIIFFISCEEELELLISHRDKILNSYCIIILPDDAENLTSKALSLYPRYLTNPSRGFKDVSAVLCKMLHNDLLYTKMLQEGSSSQPSRKTKETNNHINIT